MNDIFELGPEAVTAFSVGKMFTRTDVLDIKQLADICWTRASTLAKTQTSDPAKWARAALAGYELLSKSDEPLVAESASESAEALRSWALLRN